MKIRNKRKVSKAEINCWLKAAEQGNAIAQNNLGVCYYYGNGIRKDYEKAADCFAKAAEQGNANAQKNLGLCYYDGEGVPQDYEKAVHWLAKATEQGMDTPLDDAKMFLEIERIGHIELAVPLTNKGMILNSVPIIRSTMPDLPKLCRIIVNINCRLKKLIELCAPEIILRKEKRTLQRYVDSLFDRYQSEGVPDIKVETFPSTGKLPAWAMPGGDVIPSSEDKKRAEAIMKGTGLVPLKDAIIHLKATKAKEKEVSVEDTKPKSGDKKFKTECSK